MIRKNLFAALLFFLASWSTAGWCVQPYTMGAGDVIRVTVYEHPELNAVIRISETGNINFPLVGELSIAGLTEKQAELKLTALLESKQIVRSPHVSLIVEQYQSKRVSVLGQVAKPGVYAISRDSTLVDLIAEAGWLTEQGADVAILTKHAGGKGGRVVVDLSSVLEEGEQEKDVPVFDGDRIYVPRMHQFYIHGQVNRPDAYRLEPGMTVMQALSVAGGLTDKGTERELTINRRSGDGAGVISIPADLTHAVQPDDVIFVKESLF